MSVAPTRTLVLLVCIFAIQLARAEPPIFEEIRQQLQTIDSNSEESLVDLELQFESTNDTLRALPERMEAPKLSFQLYAALQGIYEQKPNPTLKSVYGAEAKTSQAAQLVVQLEKPQEKNVDLAQQALDILQEAKAILSSAQKTQDRSLQPRVSKAFGRLYRMEANAYNRLKKFEEGEQAGREALRFDPTPARNYLPLITALYGMQRYKQALAQLDLMRTRDGYEDWEDMVVYQRTRCQGWLGQLAQLVATASERLAQHPEDTRVRFPIGLALWRLGFSHKATKVFQEQIEHFPEDPGLESAYYGLVDAYISQGDFQSAQTASEEGKKLHSKKETYFAYTSALLANAFASEESQQFAEGLEAAALKNPDDEDALAYTLLFNERQGRPKDTEMIEQKLRARGPTDVNAQYDLARLESIRGNISEAQYWLKQAIKNGFKDISIVANHPDFEPLKTSLGPKNLDRLLSPVRSQMSNQIKECRKLAFCKQWLLPEQN